jgi:hypothetical protein
MTKGGTGEEAGTSARDVGLSEMLVEAVGIVVSIGG